MEKQRFIYDATIVNIVDGDTVDAVIDLGFSLTMKLRLRFYGIDTQEMNDKDPVLREQAQRAKASVSDRILNKQVVLETYKPDKYGRYLADIYYAGAHLNKELVTEGLAVEYFGGTR
jgi:micrococcal nuclease